MTTAFRRAKEIALTVGALGGLCCIVFALSCVAFGLTPLIVQSGSMEPTVTTGSLLITRSTPATQLRVGQVVTVKRKDRTLVTHRIVQITHRGNTASMELKGDSNKFRDVEVYDVKRAGRMVATIPFLGRVAAWMSGPIGLFLLGIYVSFLAAVVVIDRGGRPPRPGGGSRRASKRDARGTTATVVGAALLGGSFGLSLAPEPTWAAWTNTGNVGTSTLTAYTVPKPVWVSCTVTGTLAKTVTVVWNEVSTPYALDYVASGGLTVTDNGSTRQVAVTSGLLGIGTTTIHITAKLPSPNGSWVSVDLTQDVTFVTSAIASCGSHN